MIRGYGYRYGYGWPRTGEILPYGPHPLPKLDKTGWAESTWPEYTQFPIEYGKLAISNGHVQLVPDSTRILSGAAIAAVVDELEQKYKIKPEKSGFTSEPGKTIGGTIWPRKYTNALPSGNAKAPLLIFGKMGPSDPPKTPPPSPFDSWYRLESWVWEDSKPGFWRPVDTWKPYASQSKKEDLGNGNFVITTFHADGSYSKNITITDPSTGEKASEQIDATITNYADSVSRALANFRKQRASDNARWEATHKAAAGGGAPPSSASSIPAWAWVAGLGALAFILLRKPKP